MDILAILISERDRLNRAIEVLGGSIPKRRGRPPKDTNVIPLVTPAGQVEEIKDKRGWTPERRAAFGQSVRARAAKRKREAGKEARLAAQPAQVTARTPGGRRWTDAQRKAQSDRMRAMMNKS